MHFSLYLTALVAPLATLAAPTNTDTALKALEARQTALVAPPPCVRDNSTSVWETKKRSIAFARAFIYAPNITEAFTYISADYINHNPFAQNGSASAWEILSPVWDTSDIIPLRATFQDPQSWVEYNNTAFGVVVDRYRWEGGCIVEHWDQGEVFPDVPAGKAAKFGKAGKAYHSA